MSALRISIVSIALAACSTSQKADLTEKALEDPERRKEMLESTLRVLDEHPQYVDELFEMTLRHPRTLERFLANTADGVSDEDLAKRVALHLAKHPLGLRTVMIETLDASAERPKARAAIADSIEARTKLTADILVDHPKQLAAVFEAIMTRVKDDPDTAGKLKELVAQMMK